MISRKALSPVIATVIMAGVVLTIGGAIWSYSLGAASITADIYVNDTLDMLYEMQERFDVEHAVYNFDNDTLRLWIYNYGEVDVIIDVYITINGEDSESTTNHQIIAGECKKIQIDFSLDPITTQETVAIKIYSRRQNVAYYTYYAQ